MENGRVLFSFFGIKMKGTGISMSVLEGLKPASVFHFFEEICSIPHGSGNEEGLSDYLKQFAQQRGLFCIQDKVGNIIIVKEAAPGYEATANAGLIAACREVGGGTLKSIPYQPNVFAYFYNIDIFEEAGITAVPTTWDEFLDVCQKIKDAGYTPITNDNAYISSLFGYHMSRLIGEPATEEVVKNGDWDNEAVLKTAQAYEELASKGYFSETIESNQWPAGQNTELAMGTAAMYLNGSWLPNEVKDIAGEDFNWGCFSYPAVEGGVDGTEASNYGAQVFAINAKSTKAEQAFQLITYLTKGEADALLSEMSVGIPADSDNAEWPTLLGNVKPVMDSLTTRYPWAAGAEANADMTPIIIENFTKLCGGSLDAQGFVDALKAAGN